MPDKLKCEARRAYISTCIHICRWSSAPVGELEWPDGNRLRGDLSGVCGLSLLLSGRVRSSSQFDSLLSRESLLAPLRSLRLRRWSVLVRVLQCYRDTLTASTSSRSGAGMLSIQHLCDSTPEVFVMIWFSAYVWAVRKGIALPKTLQLLQLKA